jgi:hypothetical protein
VLGVNVSSASSASSASSVVIEVSTAAAPPGSERLTQLDLGGIAMSYGVLAGWSTGWDDPGRALWEVEEGRWEPGGSGGRPQAFFQLAPGRRAPRGTVLATAARAAEATLRHLGVHAVDRFRVVAPASAGGHAPRSPGMLATWLSADVLRPGRPNRAAISFVTDLPWTGELSEQVRDVLSALEPFELVHLGGDEAVAAVVESRCWSFDAVTVLVPALVGALPPSVAVDCTVTLDHPTPG